MVNLATYMLNLSINYLGLLKLLIQILMMLIEGIQAVIKYKTRGSCEPQSQLLVNILLFYCSFIVCITTFIYVFLSSYYFFYCLLFIIIIYFFFILFVFESLNHKLYASFDKYTNSFIAVYHNFCHKDR